MSRFNLGVITFNKENLKDLYHNTEAFKRFLIEDIEGKYQVTYGFDQAVYYFVQFFPYDSDAINWIHLNELDQECIDIDSMFGGLTGAELGYFLEMFHGLPSHAEFCYLDLPI